MIRVIIEHQVKTGQDIFPLLRELRTNAMQYLGYVSGETLVNTKDISNILVISTWQTLEAWNVWEESRLRATFNQPVEALSLGKSKVRTYSIVSI